MPQVQQPGSLSPQQRPVISTAKATECATATDKFLCQAIRQGREFLDQQINAEVFVSFSQQRWDGSPITKHPSTYLLRVLGDKEVYQKLSSGGKLGPKQTEPNWQSVLIRTDATWLDTPRVIFTRASLKYLAEDARTVKYEFYASKAFELYYSGLFRKSSVMVDGTGEIEFEKGSKRVRSIALRKVVKADEAKKHQFLLDNETTTFDYPPGFEEAFPVPVKCTAKLQTTNAKVIITIDYAGFRRFDSSVSFPQDNETPTLEDCLRAMRFTIRAADQPSTDAAEALPKSETAKWIEASKQSLSSASRHSESEVFQRASEITGLLLVKHTSGTQTQCTCFLYQRTDALYFLTNQHCILDFASGTIKKGQFADIKVSSRDVIPLGEDTAVLRVGLQGRWSESRPSFPFGQPNYSEAPLSSGFPNANYLDVTGPWAGAHPPMLVDDKVRVNGAYSALIAPIHGASGSPAFDHQFRLVGLRFGVGYQKGESEMTAREPCAGCQALSLFVGGDVVYALLKEHGLIER